MAVKDLLRSCQIEKMHPIMTIEVTAPESQVVKCAYIYIYMYMCVIYIYMYLCDIYIYIPSSYDVCMYHPIVTIEATAPESQVVKCGHIYMRLCVYT